MICFYLNSSFPEVHQWGPFGCTQTQARDDPEVRTTKNGLCHNCRYWCCCTLTKCLFIGTFMTWVSSIKAKYICSVNMSLTVMSVHSYLTDTTPTPTRFLKNCEEVGLFNELASSFTQDEEEKRAKNAVRRACGSVLCLCCLFWRLHGQYFWTPKPMKLSGKNP